MSSCGTNRGSVNKTFIIEPLSITGGSPTLSACTTMYTNLIKSCSGNTSIYMTEDIVIISGDTNVLGNITATTIDASIIYSGGTNLIDIINDNDTFITGFTYDDSNNLTITRNDGTPLTINLSVMSALTINGDLTVIGAATFNSISANTISINGGEIMNRIPDSLDFRLFGNQSSTGLIEYGGLSANTSDNTKFDVGLMKGWIVDNTTNPTTPVVQYIDYSGGTGITLTYLASNPVTYIGLSGDTTADIVQSPTPFEPDNHRDFLELGVVIHSDNVIVNVTNDLPAMGIDPTGQFYDLMHGLGYFNLDLAGEQGNIYSANGINLNINKTGGKIFAHGSNYTNDSKNPHIKELSSGETLTFRYRISDSTEWANTTEINPNLYESGGMTAVTPTNKFTVQRIVMFPSGISRLQYGQNVYDSLDDGEASLSTEEFIIEGNIKGNGLLRGFIIVKESTTDLSDVSKARFISANYFGHANDTVVGNVHRTQILNNASTGLRNGGVLSADTSTTFTVFAGSGLIVDNTTDSNNPITTEVVWDDITGNTLTNLSGDVLTFISIDEIGNITQYPLLSPPNQSDKRDNILLGAISHSNNINITNIYNAPITISSPINQHEDLTSSIGTFNITGNHINPIVGTLELNKEIGKSYFYGGNFQTDITNPSVLDTDAISGSSTPLNPLVYATGGEIIGISGYSIDTDNYDLDGLGVLNTIPNNKYVAHRIWYLPINNLLVFQYGQTYYNSLNLAIDGFSTENFIEPPGLNLGAYLISVVITKSGESDLSNTTTTKFIQQGKFAGTGGGGAIADTLQSTYNNSTNPEIITDGVRGAVDIRVGSGLNTDRVLTFQNLSGDTTGWVNGLGDSLFNSISGNTFYGDGSNLTGIPDSYTTASTLVNNTVFFDRNDQLSAYTVDLSSLVTTGSTDFYVTGGTFIKSASTVTLTRNDNVDVDITGFTDLSTTAVTLDGNVLYFDTNEQLSAYTVDLSSLVVSGGSGDNFYTTDATLIDDVLYFDRTDTLSAYTVSLSGITGSGSTSNKIRVTGARNKNNQNNVFLRYEDGLPFNVVPYRPYKDSVITDVVASGRDADTWVAHILSGTSVVTDSIYSLSLTAEQFNMDNAVNLSVSSGDTLYLYMSGTSIAYPKIDIYIE